MERFHWPQWSSRCLRQPVLTLWLLSVLPGVLAQDSCDLQPWDLLPAPIRKQVILANVDLDGDGLSDSVFRANGDALSTTVFKLDYSATRDVCATLAASPSRVGYREFELVGRVGQPSYSSPGIFQGIAIFIQTWVDTCKPDPFGCFEYAEAAGDFATNTIAYVGMRLIKADGNHFGWVKFSRPCNKPWVILELESYALHPLPNTPIPAGVVPQPELVVERGPGTVTLSWRPEWQGYRLEWLQILAPTIAWKPVDGVVNNRVTLPANALTAYFRLAKEP